MCLLTVSVLFELVMIRSHSINWSIFKSTLLLKFWLKYPYMASQALKDVINGYTLKKMKRLRIDIFCNQEDSRKEKLSKFSLKLSSKCMWYKKERKRKCWVSKAEYWRILKCFIWTWNTFKEVKPQFQKIEKLNQINPMPRKLFFALLTLNQISN